MHVAKSDTVHDVFVCLQTRTHKHTHTHTHTHARTHTLTHAHTHTYTHTRTHTHTHTHARSSSVLVEQRDREWVGEREGVLYAHESGDVYYNADVGRASVSSSTVASATAGL